MKPIRIAQVSDVHISPDGAPVRGVDVRKQLLCVLNKLRTETLDLLVLSGDLAAHDGEAGAYQWIQENVQDFPVPVLYMVGNHDRLEVMQQHLNLPVPSAVPGVYCFAYSLEQHPLLFLDTGDNNLSEAQMHWLRETCVQYQENCLLFMHHPPLHCGCDYMDNHYYLHNREAVWAVLQDIPNIQHIFCGHYHTDRNLSRDGKQVYLTPSTMMQLGTSGEKFSLEHISPGWRMIAWDGVQLTTHTHYCRS